MNLAGGSSWELRIDLQEFQKEKKKTPEEDKEPLRSSERMKKREEGQRGRQKEAQESSRITFTSVGEPPGAPNEPPRPAKGFPRSPEEPTEKPVGECEEAPWRCFGSSWRSKKLPRPRSSIHSSVSEPSRTLPEVPKSQSIGPVDVFEPPEGGQVRYKYA